MQNLNEYEELVGNGAVGFRLQSDTRVPGGFGVYPLLTLVALVLSLCVFVGCGGDGGGNDDVNENGILSLVRPLVKVDGSLLTVADLNSDGHPDLVTWNSVLFGNGDGTFQDERKDVTDGCCVRIVADFNSDGHPDLLKDNSVLLGNGDGTFQAEQRVDDSGSSKTVADFNLDGYLDLVTYTSPSVLLGNGDGTFQAEQRVDDADSLVAVDIAPLFNYLQGIIADFNSDGYPDLLTESAVQMGNDEVIRFSVRLGNGDGTFQAEQQVDGPDGYGLSVADFNLDGYPDLRGLNVNLEPPSWIRLGNGDGTFQAELPDDIPLVGTIADINGDDYPDLVQIPGVRLGNGDGTFQPAQIVFMEDDDVHSPSVRGVADFNNDGHSDLIIDSKNFPGSGVDYWLLLSNGDGTFQAEQILHRGDTRASARHLLIADLNSDGLADLIIAFHDQVYIFLSR